MHGPEGGAGSRGYIDLVVDMLDVVIGGFGCDEQAVGDLLGGESAGRKAQHIHFAMGEAAGMLRPGWRGGFRFVVAGGGEHRVGRAQIESALRSKTAQFGCGFLCGEGRTIGALGSHSHADFRRGQQADSGIAMIGVHAPVVAEAVALFVVRGRNRVECRERRRAAQHLLGQHGVQLDTIELRAGERTALVEDGV